MLPIQTHQKINPQLCGEPIELGQDFAIVRLKLLPEMIVDASNLIHGGFIFSLGDYAAMLAVNHPNVVLAQASVQFLKPVQAGQSLEAKASIIKSEGKKRIVQVSISNGQESIFQGEFVCVIPLKHVLS